MRLEPGSDGVKVGLRRSEAFAEFLRRQPVMKVWRILGVEFVKELQEGGFLFGRALQLEQHVLHSEIVGYRAAITCEPRFWMGVAMERHAVHFVDALRDSRASMQA
jgi:hypothetical protein